MLGVPAAIAVSGFFVAYVVNLRLAERADQLERLSRQLSDFHGPLFALVKATDISWKAFRANHRPGGSFWGDPGDPPSELELCAHVATYEAILGQWAESDFSQHVSAVPFPRKALTDYAVESFVPLKSKQHGLLTGRSSRGRSGTIRHGR